MTATPLIHRDERTMAVENASYRLSYLFLSFGVLAAVAYRSLFRGEAAWDLLALVVLGGVLSTAYQGFFGILSKHWAVVTLLSVAAAIVVAALAVWSR